MNIIKHVIKRGDLFLTDFENENGSVQCGKRPAIVIQNDNGNKHSPTVIVAKITSKLNKHRLPTHIRIKDPCMVKGSMILMEQVVAIDKNKLGKFIGHVSEKTIRKIDKGIDVSMKNKK